MGRAARLPGPAAARPNGHVIGIDMHAALKLATTCGHELTVLAELLPAAEAGLVEALSTDRAQGTGL